PRHQALAGRRPARRPCSLESVPAAALRPVRLPMVRRARRKTARDKGEENDGARCPSASLVQVSRGNEARSVESGARLVGASRLRTLVIRRSCVIPSPTWSAQGATPGQKKSPRNHGPCGGSRNYMEAAGSKLATQLRTAQKSLQKPLRNRR